MNTLLSAAGAAMAAPGDPVIWRIDAALWALPAPTLPRPRWFACLTPDMASSASSLNQARRRDGAGVHLGAVAIGTATSGAPR